MSLDLPSPSGRSLPEPRAGARRAADRPAPPPDTPSPGDGDLDGGDPGGGDLDHLGLPTACAAPRPRRRWRRRLALVLAPLLGLVAVELGLRFLLFHPSALAARLGRDLRDPGRFADPDLEPEYWRLRRALEGNPDDDVPHHPQAELGWVNPWIDPGTLEHADEAALDGRRPILLHGASFAQCLPKGTDCFEHRLAGSVLAEDHALLNFGVSGYGVDQVLLLMRRTLPRFVERRPVVVVLVVLETDLGRAALDFRGARKPHLHLEAGRPVGDGADLGERSHDYLARTGPGIGSYAWRYFLRHADALPVAWRREWSGLARLERERDALVEGVLLALHHELEAEGLDHFFLLCSAPKALRRGGPMTDLAERLVCEHRLPHVDARPALREAIRAGDEAAFHARGPGRNHPNAAGTRVLFEALLAGVEGRRDAELFAPSR